MEKGVAVLSISSRDHNHARLRQIFSHSNWKIFHAYSIHEAVDFLCCNGVGVVLCDCHVSDGTWRDILDLLPNVTSTPVLVVCSQDPDEGLWAEVLNRGAYDVLAKPFDFIEVTRIVSLAWLHWRDGVLRRERVGATPAPKPPMPDGLQAPQALRRTAAGR
jgi:DNA-binding response OmpR family regulator